MLNILNTNHRMKKMDTQNVEWQP